MSMQEDADWAGTSVVIERSESWTVLEAARLTLAEEEIPSVVEAATDAAGGWCLSVATAARADAQRVLEQRRAMGSMVDWEQVDVGEPPREVQSVLEGRDGLHRISRVLWVVGLVAGIITLGLTVLGIALVLIG